MNLTLQSPLLLLLLLLLREKVLKIDMTRGARSENGRGGGFDKLFGFFEEQLLLCLHGV
jgi:hypothetical protein